MMWMEIPARKPVVTGIESRVASHPARSKPTTYSLTEIGTGKVVVTGTTFARVSYDIPGQEQRFARVRGLRDAELRAAKVISDNIRSRLASYFIAGT